VGVSLAAVGDGLRMDAIAVYDESKMNETQRQILASKAEFRSDGFFPEETLAFVHGQRPDLFWASYRESLINLTSQSDFEAAMATFEQTFGFNPDQELFPYLDGEWALAVLPDTDSVFNSSGQGSLGFSLLAGTSQEEKLSHTMDQFNLHAETLNAQVDTAELGDAQGYSITFAGLESPISYYGVHKGYLAITSSTNVFKDTFDGGQALRDQADYKGVWKSFPANTSPVFFANVSGLVEIVRDSMQGSVRDSFDETAQPYLKPLKAVALGVVPLQKGVVHTVLIVFINQ
jgi:hypothetical protein